MFKNVSLVFVAGLCLMGFAFFKAVFGPAGHRTFPQIFVLAVFAHALLLIGFKNQRL